MAAKKPSQRDIRPALLIVYVSIGVLAVVLTVAIAFSEVADTAQNVTATPAATRTLSPLIRTQQAEGSVNDDRRHQDSRAAVTATTAPDETPAVTAEH
jgi:hypothetical protein